jgi:hypothetical protein
MPCRPSKSISRGARLKRQHSFGLGGRQSRRAALGETSIVPRDERHANAAHVQNWEIFVDVCNPEGTHEPGGVQGAWRFPQPRDRGSRASIRAAAPPGALARQQVVHCPSVSCSCRRTANLQTNPGTPDFQ